MSQEMTDQHPQKGGELSQQQRDFMQALDEIGVKTYDYKTIKDNFFPDASAHAVVSYLRYCRARNLDPFKRPAHIVPMWDRVKNDDTGQWESRKREVVLQGIYEYRTTAVRTGLYGGHSTPQYGDNISVYGRDGVPEWCAMTFYRWNARAEEWTAFPVKVWFEEVAATVPEFELNDAGYPKKNDRGQKIATGRQVLNARWNKAPRQMLTKCTEAAGLREAFPDEIGGEPTVDEMDAWTQPPIDHESGSAGPPRASLKDRLAGAKTVGASGEDSVGVTEAMGATVRTADQEADAELREVEEGGKSASESPQEPESGDSEEQTGPEQPEAQAPTHTAKKRKKKAGKKKAGKKAAEKPPEEPEKAAGPEKPAETDTPPAEVLYTVQHIIQLMDEADSAETLSYAMAKAEGLSQDEQDEVRDYFRTRIRELNEQARTRAQETSDETE